MTGIVWGARWGFLCAALMLELSVGCGGQVETTTSSHGTNGPGTTTEGVEQRGANGGASSGNSGGSSANGNSMTQEGTRPHNSVDASSGPGGQGGTSGGSCEVPASEPIVCSATSGPADAVFKGCSSDSDCKLLRYDDDCSTPSILTAYGVAIAKETAFRQCYPLPTCPPGGVSAPPGTRVETRGEDGRNNLDAGPGFVVKCEKHGSCPGRCRSSLL